MMGGGWFDLDLKRRKMESFDQLSTILMANRLISTVVAVGCLCRRLVVGWKRHVDLRMFLQSLAYVAGCHIGMSRLPQPVN